MEVSGTNNKPGIPEKVDTSSSPRPPAAVPFMALLRFADWIDGILLTLSVVCAAGSGVVIPLVSLILGDLLNGNADPVAYAAGVNRAALYMTIVSVGAFVFLGGGTGVAFITSQRQAHRLRQAAFRAIIRQDAGYGDRNSLPELAARLSEDTLTFQSGLGEKTFLVISGIAQFAGSICLAFSVSADAYRLALTLLAVVPFAVASIGLFMAYLQRLGSDSDDAYAKAGAVLTEALGPLFRTIHALGATEHYVDARYNAHLAEAEKAGRSKGIIAGAGQGIFIFTMCLLYAVGLFAGAGYIKLNRDANPDCVTDPTASFACFNGGNVISVLFAVVGGAFALGLVVPNLSYATYATGAAARLYALIDRIPEADPYADGGLAPAPGSVRMRIVFEEVSFRYPSRPDETALGPGFSCTMESGQRVALVGPSGSGKSTIVALLLRLYEPTKGRITLDGVDLKDYNLRWLRSQMAWVGQEPQLMPGSIFDNIAAGVVPGVAGPSALLRAEVEEAAKAAAAHDFISALPRGYETVVGSLTVSGGQKQRLCIARAVVRGAPLMLFDESTSALDSTSEARLMRDIERLLASSAMARTTSITVAHRLSTVKGSDVILALEKGQLREAGTHEQLLAKPDGLYARLWEAQHTGNAGRSLSSGRSSVGANGSAASAAAAVVEAATATEDGESSDALRLPSSVVPTASIVAIADDGKAAGDKDKGPPSQHGAWAVVPKVPWRKAWLLQRPEARWVALGLLLACANGVLLPGFSILLTKFVSVFYWTDSDAMVLQGRNYFFIFLGIAFFCFALNTLQGLAFAAAGEPFIRRLRAAAFRSIMSQGVGFLEAPSNAPGALAARLGIDAVKLKMALGARLGEKVSALSTLVAGLIVAYTASWQLALIITACGPLVVYAADAENQVALGMEAQIKAAYADAGAVASDAVAAIRVVHVFGLHDAIRARYDAAIDKPYRASFRRALGLSLGYGSSQASQNLVCAVVFKAGLWLMTEHPTSGVTPEAVVQTFLAFQFSCFGLVQLVSLFSDMGSIRDSLRGFFTMILRPTDLDASEEAVAVWAPGAAPEEAARRAVPHGRVVFDDVHFAYPTRPEAPVLRGLSLTVEPGQVVALVGESGSGKSSIVGLLLRLYEPSSGNVTLDNVPLRMLPARAVRDAIGWVPQEAPLAADSLAYNIALGRSGGAARKLGPDQGMPRDAAPDSAPLADFQVPEDVLRAARDANAAGFVMEMRHGFATHVGDGGLGLSGGQKQRVAIARAIIRDPQILLLDEATSALDSQSERVVQDSIDALLAKQHASGGRAASVIIIAHRLSTVATADKVCVVHEGRIVEEGTFAELAARPDSRFRRLAEAQGMLGTNGGDAAATQAKLV